MLHHLEDFSLPIKEESQGGGLISISSVFSVLSVADGVYSSGTISNATMLMILISGLIAGPAVSL